MKHHAHIAHHVKGRMRVKVPSAKGNPEALESMQKSLRKMAGVQTVTVNEHTGSITIEYDPKYHDDFHEDIREEGIHSHEPASSATPMLGEVGETFQTLEEEAAYLASHSHTAKVVFEFIKQCDLSLKKATDNNVDLKVVGPLALAVYAFLEMGFEAATPVWLTLGLFSFNHLVELHTHHTHKLLAQAQAQVKTKAVPAS